MRTPAVSEHGEGLGEHDVCRRGAQTFHHLEKRGVILPGTSSSKGRSSSARLYTVAAIRGCTSYSFARRSIYAVDVLPSPSRLQARMYLPNVHNVDFYDHLNGVNILLSTHSKSDSSGVSYAGVDKDRIDTYVRLLSDNIHIYPRLVIVKSGMRTVLLCSGLTYRGEARAAIPDFRRKRLLLDVDYARIDKEYSICVLHHDFFHLVDFYAFKHLYKDKQWEALNDPKFVYADNEMSKQKKSYSFVTSKSVAGFVTPYATLNAAEDKAETFCHLIVNHASLLDRIAVDDVLATKVNCIKRRLRRLCPDMNEGFWQNRIVNDFWMSL